MFLNQFPDLAWLKKESESRFQARQSWDGSKLPRAGWPNVVLNVNSESCHRDNIRGPFSIFTNLSGESAVEVNGKTTRIREGFYFVTNEDQHYTLDITAKTKAETFNIHFGNHFMDELSMTLSSRPECLLENVFTPGLDTTALDNRLHRRSAAVTNLMYTLRAQRTSSMLHFEQLLASIAEHVLTEQSELKKLAYSLPVIKSSTREEIFHRLGDAVDYMYSFYDHDITLDQLAKISCLSKFHFLRLFKLAYKKTPGHFLEEVRITKATELLKHGVMPVKEIARSVGYKSSGSFSRMFRNHIGVYPTQYV